MSKTISILATFAIIFIGSMIFPQFIACDSWKTALLAAIIMVIAELIIGLLTFGLVFASSAMAAVKNTLVPIVIAFVIALIVGIGGTYLALLAAEHFVTGFSISGIIPRIIISIIIGSFAVKKNNSKSSNKDE